MKCIVLLTVCVASLQANPLFYPGGGLGLGGIGGGGGGYLNGGGYGRGMYNGGASGLNNAGYGGSRLGGYHNLGAHHNSVTSLNRADNSGFHNIGGGDAMTNGGYLGNGYNRYLNGANGYGNGYGMGGGGSQMLI